MDYVLADRVEVTDFLRHPHVVEYLDHPSVSLRLVSPNGDYLYASSGVKNLLGYTAHELAAMNAFGLVHPDDYETVREIAQEIGAGKSVRMVTRAKTRAREFRWVETRLAPFEGQVAAFVRATEAPEDGKAHAETIEPFL